MRIKCKINRNIEVFSNIFPFNGAVAVAVHCSNQSN